MQVSGPRELIARGEIDVHTAPALAERVDAVAADGGDIVIDMRDVTFLDSSGLSVLLRTHDRLQPDGRLVLDSPSSIVRRLLEVAGLEGVFELD